MHSFNLKHTPNIELMRCRLNELPCHQMVINLHWLGMPRLRGTNFFTHNEVALINVVLNLTRLLLVNQNPGGREAHLTEELAKLKLFETVVKGPSAKLLKSKDYHLSNTAVSLFAETFMATLEKLSTMTHAMFVTRITKYSTGMSFEGELEEKLSFPYMRSFCKSLFNNSFFVASLAGCKSAFHSKPALRAKFETSENLTMEALTMKVGETTDLIYDYLREKVFLKQSSVDDVGTIQYNDGNIQYHMDLGIEFSPLEDDNVSFLLNGEKAKVRFKEYLIKPRTDRPYVADEVLITSHVDVPMFEERDSDLHATGEVQPPTLARRIENESDDEEEPIGERTQIPEPVFMFPLPKNGHQQEHKSQPRFYVSAT